MADVVVIWAPIPWHLDPVAVARFARMVDISGGLNACHPWTGYLMPNGYGKFSFEGQPIMATRFALELKLARPLKPEMQACHTCDNPPCVNGRHLFEGTAQQNHDDAVRKGRFDAAWAALRGTRRPPEQYARGEGIPMAKLTDEDVREIRRLNAEGVPQKELAQTFDVHDSQISRIVRRERWSHVS